MGSTIGNCRTALYLTSLSSDFVTGTTIPVDGGREVPKNAKACLTTYLRNGTERWSR